MLGQGLVLFEAPRGVCRVCSEVVSWGYSEKVSTATRKSRKSWKLQVCEFVHVYLEPNIYSMQKPIEGLLVLAANQAQWGVALNNGGIEVGEQERRSRLIVKSRLKRVACKRRLQIAKECATLKVIYCLCPS
jgi:hypothetical protein